ncbi:hypothetical protein ACLKA6_013675 [Drosophila palustris]
MLQTIIWTVLIIGCVTSFSEAIPISEYNETKFLLSVNSQLAEIRAEQERHIKLIDGLVKDFDIQDRQEKSLDQLFKAMDVQSIRKEQKKQGKLIEGLAKESDIQLVRVDISSLRAEQERIGKDGVDKESSIQQLKEELEKQRKDGVDKESNIQQLRADLQSVRGELKLLKEDEANKESSIQQLKEELEKQRKDGVDKESNIQQLKSEQEEQKKLIDGLFHPRDCAEAKFNGINDILIPKFSRQPFQVACDAFTQGGGWTIILSRLDGSVDFYRNWTEYQKGFGDLNGEFFLGLDKIHALTADRDQELLVILENFEGDERYETYDAFAIGNEDQLYELHTLGEASGTAGDSLSYHHGKKFSTFDRDNDLGRGNCAEYFYAAWWFGACYSSKLTGTHGEGIAWGQFGPSMKRAVMLIRPRK